MTADVNGAAMANGSHASATNGFTAHLTNGSSTNGSNTNGSSTNGVNGTAPKSVGTNGVNGHYHLNGNDPSSKNPFDGLQEPMAIVGMAMRLPGGVRTADSFWDMLINKRDGRCRIPADRYNVDAFYSAALKRGTVKMQHGYFLEDVDLRDLDPSFFSMTKSEVEKLDPQHRLLLEVVRECLENAGETNWRGKEIGCYVGVFGEDWQDIHAKDTQDFGMYRITGYGDFLLGNRVSYEYDFTGPSMTVKTGCSSSLICLHLACQAIAKGECSSAIVGGTNLIMSPTMSIAMTEQGVLSSSGMCKTFDADADGYARGDAINAVYVKKLSDAIRDGDPIRAVIRGSSTNSDGRTPGISHPSSESHEALMRHAYDAAGIHDFSETAFVECHGTGTSIGDPLETQAVANVFGGKGVYIGSVKPNVGHSEGASGVTSIIKSVLALEHKTIPPNINFKKPHPKIPFQKSNLQVPVEPTPWPKSRVERVSVNSFGIGGANAHIIIDSAASYGIKSNSLPNYTEENRPKSSLLVFSANHPDSLRQTTDNYREYVKAHPDKVNDLAYTLSARRERLPYRAYCVTDGTGDLQVSPATRAGAPPNPVFVFTGQGAQWAGMGKQLMAEYPSFLEDIREMDRSLATCAHPPAWTIEDEFTRPEASSRVQIAEFSQPLCTALQVALINLLRIWNVHPTAVVGHSSGEIAGAYTAESINAHDAIRLAYYRGQVAKLQLRAGGMAAVGLGRDEVASYLVPGVIVACENSPSNVTLSGDVKPLEGVLATLKLEMPDILARRLKVDMAYHSHHMTDVGEQYEFLIGNMKGSKRPKIPFYSTVIGTCIHEDDFLGPAYWRQNLESPVLFSTAVKQLLQERPEGNLFLEVGPHSALAGPLRQIFRASDASPPYVSALARDKSCTQTLLAAAGQLHMHSVNLDLCAVSPGNKVLTDLPTYAWNHETKYWDESRLSRDWRLREYPHHDILGSRVAEGTDLEPTWRTVLHLDDVPWIRDHMILQDVIFPGAGYVAMAGEAIRQITKVDDFTVRRVVIGAAMVLGEGKTTEIMTHLCPVRLTDTLDSSWYEFVISSHNGASWTKHCVGQVRGGSEHQKATPDIKDLPRKVESTRWYQTMRKVGLNYGPAFQGLRGITTSATSQTAVAHISNSISPNDSEYQIHPSTLDVCIQIFSAAVAQGLPRKFNTLAVPTAIDELYVSRPDSAMQMKAHASTTVRGAITGSGFATANGKVVMDLKGLKMSPIEDDDGTEDLDPHAAVHLEWNQDIDFADASTLIRPTKTVREPYILVEQLTLLCIIEAAHQLKTTQTSLDHLEKFRAWLTYQTLRAQNGEYQLVQNPQQLVAMDSKSRLSLIDTTIKEVQGTEGALIGGIIKRIFDASVSIFDEKTDALDLLASDGSLNKLYDFADRWDLNPFLRLLRHSKPNLKVLEIGAGTGATTSIILNGLVSTSGERMYSSYTFTDISAGFFVSAKDRFKDFQNVEYAILDISRDPVEQGLEEGSFDFIVAANVLHATPKIKETLQNVRKLLSPNGRLLLQELCPISNWANFIMGVLPGWWLGEGDGRPYEPYISPDRWDEELRGAGFSGADTIVYDEPAPFQTNAHIVARPMPETITAHRVTLLVDSNWDNFKSQVEALFAKKGFGIDLCSLTQTPPPHQDVISLLDLDSPFFDNLSQDNFSAILAFMNRLEDSGVLWLTRSAQTDCRDPRYAQAIGMTRTIRNELAIDLATLEIDHLNSMAWESVFAVFSKFARRTQDAEMNPEYEYSLSNGTICTGRFHWFSVMKELSVVPQGNNFKKLQIRKRGFLKTLHWAERPLQKLTGDEVQVDIRAVGMNFKDVLIAMGIVDGNKAEGDGLGCESAGVVNQVGPDVKDLKIGDRVAVFSGGSYSTTLNTTSKLCAKMADGLTFEEAATMPCVYGTVIYSLLEIAKLEKDQTVLIHSACGGIGISAIQVCQMAGAKIYATVGNEEKVQYLMNTFGLPRDRIFNSRNTSFLPDIMRATYGRGVDVVLNSLSGELLHASWQCVAEFGKMVEIGKRDFIGRGKLMMDVFEANRSFFGIDLAQICADRPEITKRLLEKCMDYCGQGFIQPIKPVKLFEAAQIEEAFRFMQKGQHIGKIVVSMPQHQEELPTASNPQQLTLRPDVSYLLVGGLGGLGKSVSTWMVENGARNLVYLGRSAGMSEDDKIFFEELRSLGCTVDTVVGSVSKLEDVKKFVSRSTLPVAGVIQMSMVLRDRPLKEMTHEDWEAAIQPKVQGTWNLHHVLKDLPHDFFVLFSSFSGIVGHWGQANYAAANTFLDAFTQYRHQQGLPASVLDIGAMEDVGYVSQNAEVQQHFRSTAVYPLHEQELLDSLHLAILRSASPPSSIVSSSTGFRNPNQIGVGLRSTLPMSSPANRSIWKRDLRMALYRNFENADTTDTSGANEGLKQFLSSVAADSTLLNDASSAEFLAHEIGVTLFGFMLKPLDDLDVTVPLTALGVDSLVSIELKNWCRQKLGIEISVLEILNVENLAALGQAAVDGLKARFGVTRTGEEFLQMKAP